MPNGEEQGYSMTPSGEEPFKKFLDPHCEIVLPWRRFALSECFFLFCLVCNGVPVFAYTGIKDGTIQNWQICI